LSEPTARTRTQPCPWIVRKQWRDNLAFRVDNQTDNCLEKCDSPVDDDEQPASFSRPPESFPAGPQDVSHQADRLPTVIQLR
jgi:hypothetical protein